MVSKFFRWLCPNILRLQEGRFYRSKDGVIYGPLREIGTTKSGYCFMDDKTGYTWTSSGRYSHVSEWPTDLVEEVHFAEYKFAEYKFGEN